VFQVVGSIGLTANIQRRNHHGERGQPREPSATGVESVEPSPQSVLVCVVVCRRNRVVWHGPDPPSVVSERQVRTWPTNARQRPPRSGGRAAVVPTNMPVMAHTTRRVTYRGDPAFASMLVQMLEQEGAKVKWERPHEQRGIEEMAQEVIVQMVAVGSLTAIKVALDKFRKHIHGTAVATIEDGDELGDDHDQ